MPITVESLFERATSHAVEDCERWRPVGPQVDLQVERCDAHGASLLRSVYEINAPFGNVVALSCPEMSAAFLNSGSQVSHESDHPVVRASPDMVAPGDAVIKLEVRSTKQTRKINSLVGTSAMMSNMPPDGSKLLLARAIIRHNFPEFGMATVVSAPLHPDGGQLLDSWGVFNSIVAIIKPHSDPCKTVVTEIRRVDTLCPSWAVARLAEVQFAPNWANWPNPTCRSEGPKLETHYLQHIKRHHGRILRWKASALCMAVGGNIGAHVVVTLSKCTKGPPLLPVITGNSFDLSSDPLKWVQAQKRDLPSYLRDFLEHFGVSDVDVYDSLGGRQLVPYQAVLWRAAWERVWDVLKDAFVIQRAAYRRMLGGECAPQLGVGTDPKYKLTRPTLQIETNLHSWLPLRNTFVHFGVDSSRAKLRCGSMPPSFDATCLIADA